MYTLLGYKQYVLCTDIVKYNDIYKVNFSALDSFWTIERLFVPNKSDAEELPSYISR